MAPKTYSLRPPAIAKDAGLETLFRIEMKKDDMMAEGIKAGDAIAVTSQTTGKGGVGVAYLSSDTAKSQGNNSFVKIHPKLREFMGLELSEKCSITKYEGGQRRIKIISLSEKGGPHNDGLSTSAVGHWAATTLERQFGAIAGSTFTISPNQGLHSVSKRTLAVDAIESDDAVEREKLAVPFWFKGGFSKVIYDGSGISTRHDTTKEETTAIQLSFTGLPGLEEQLQQLSKCIERVNRQVEERYQHLAGCLPILLHGPSGTGKTAIMTQLAKAPGWTQIVRLLPSELGSSTSKINSAISKAFTEASAAQPSLLIIDDIDSIAGRQSESSAIATILADHARTIRGTRIQIIAAARRPIDVNQKLLPCFKKKIEIPTPSPLSRRKILAHFSVGLSENDVLQYVAEKTHAFNAEDLDELCIKAHEAAEQRQLRTSSGETNNITEVSAQDTTATTYVAPSSISKQDFQQALRHVHPSLMNELYIEVPKVHWSDIAGSTQVKRKLWEAVELPLKHPDIVSRLNLHLNHGILLYGPPGCSKTMTAKALATESGLNFIAVKGPELVSKYVGESEYKIREIFRKARAASPSVIFFDEIDSIVPNREGGGGHEGLNTVATLLNEMDGVEDLQGVLVLAATNRPDAIDPALLRPGRLGTSLYVGPPDYDAILEILKMRTSKMGGKGLDLPIIASRIADNGYFSGADVGAVCDAAGMLCATEAVGEGADQNLELEQRHLEQALLDVEPSLNKAQLGFLSGWGVGKGGE